MQTCTDVAGQREIVGLAILPMTAPPSLTPASPTHPTQAGPEGQSPHGSRAAQDPSELSDANDAARSSRLWVLPLASLQDTVDQADGSAHDYDSAAYTSRCRVLMMHLFTTSHCMVCFDVQGRHNFVVQALCA